MKHGPHAIRHLIVSLVAFTGLTASAAPPDLSDPRVQEAVTLMQEAFTEAGAGHYERAAEIYARACTLTPTPRCLRSLARQQLRIGHPVDALATFRRELAHPSLAADVTPDKIALDRRDSADAYAQTGHLEVHAPDGAELLVDGQPLSGPVPADHVVDVMPGTHKVAARQGDTVVARADVTIDKGARLVVDLQPHPSPDQTPAVQTPVEPPPPSLQQPDTTALPPPSWWSTPHTIGVIAGTAGVASIIAGGLFTAASRSANSTGQSLRPCIGTCPALQNEDAAEARDNTLGWVFAGIGAAAITTGAVLTFWPQSSHRSIMPTATSNSAGFQFQGDF